ncbi:hypothetical protein JST97_29075 [bacterium]|nr:hypothetical protein [bacterium]
MSLIDSLKQNYQVVGATAPYPTPQNLRELRGLLRQACLNRSVHQDLPYYCNWYSEYLTKVHNDENRSMSKTRGKARRMWAEQSLVYQDLIQLLSELSTELPGRDWGRLEEATDSLFELVDELLEAVQEMQDWTVSEEPRCLKCGWNGATGHCPHCQVQVLKPVRTFATQVNSYVTLAPHQSVVFTNLLSVLEGERDVSVLKAPLQKLASVYQDSLRELESAQHLEIARTGQENIYDALAGVSQMLRVFEDSDAQHLEDGWSMIFQADRANLAAVEEVNSGAGAVAAAYEIIRDQISLSNE